MTAPNGPEDGWRNFCLDLVLLLAAVDIIAVELYLLTH